MIRSSGLSVVGESRKSSADHYQVGPNIYNLCGVMWTMASSITFWIFC